MARVNTRYYVVWKGRKPGIYMTWAEAEAQVKGYTDAQFKAFPTIEAAKDAYQGRYDTHITHRGPTVGRAQPFYSGTPPILDSISVDAACAGVPGPVEYRAVETDTRVEVFRFGPFFNGTNNIGEFLAIVEALRMLTQQGRKIPIYTDSVTALAWVRARRCNTSHPQDALNAPLFRLVHDAEVWLRNSVYVNPILKWDTDAWGENPADFGRK